VSFSRFSCGRIALHFGMGLLKRLMTFEILNQVVDDIFCTNYFIAKDETMELKRTIIAGKVENAGTLIAYFICCTGMF
jgi:hypothetical protein